jgi:replicative DNA helicase
MKLFNTSLEKLAIRTITAGTPASSYLLSAIKNADYFNRPITKACFDRIKRLVKKEGTILSWDELLRDPVIGEKYLKELNDYKKKPRKSIEDAKKIAESLNKYRKMRKLLEASIHTQTELRKDGVDIDKLVDENSEFLLDAKTGVDSDDIFVHMGVGGNSAKMVKKILKGEAQFFIPTGFKTFDNINRGLPVGGLAIMAGSTGSGKSVMAKQLNKNFALAGANSALVTLEMENEEVMMRRISNLSGIEFSKILFPEKLTKKEKHQILRTSQEYDETLLKKNIRESFVAPKEDVSLEDTLFLLKPYGYDAIIIDYVGLLAGMADEDMWRLLLNAARVGKRWASSTGTLLIFCAQLSEEGIIRYSRGLKEYASNMWSWTYNNEQRENGETLVEISQQKVRFGKDFPFSLYFDFAHMTIRDPSDEELEESEKRESESGDDPKKKKKRKGLRRDGEEKYFDLGEGEK